MISTATVAGTWAPASSGAIGMPAPPAPILSLAMIIGLMAAFSDRQLGSRRRVSEG